MATSSNEWALKSRKSKLLLVLFLHWRTPCSHESTDTACPGSSEQKHFQMKRQISCMPFLSFLPGQLPGVTRIRFLVLSGHHKCTHLFVCALRICALLSVLETVGMISIHGLCGREQKHAGNVVPDWGLYFALWHLTNIPIIVAVIITVTESLIILMYAHNRLTCGTRKCDVALPYGICEK